MAVEKISTEAYKKALVTLGLEKAETSPEEIAAQAKEQEELKKAEDAKVADKAKLESELADTLKKAEEIKAKIEGKEIVKAEEPAKKIETPVQPEISKAIVEEISKGFEDKISALATMIAKKDEENAELKKSVESQSEFLTKLGEEIGLIKKQPLDRKSLSTATYVERFAKAEGSEKKDGDGITVSLSDHKQRAELASVMFKAVEEKGIDDKGYPKDREFAKAIQSVELGFLGGNQLEVNKIAARLKKEHNITVIK